jgi:serine/threonine-protein kinase
MVHRDIKPHNLLVASYSEQHPTPPGMVKILDMGLARVGRPEGDDSSGSLTGEGTLIGTLDYISPEQARNPHTVDIRADLYSLGCTFFYLLTGRTPYGGTAALEKLMKHQLDPIPSPRDVRPEVSQGVADIVRKLMAKRAEDRYQSPAELIAALDALHVGPASSSDWNIASVKKVDAVAAETSDSGTLTYPGVPPATPKSLPNLIERPRRDQVREKGDGRLVKMIVAGAVAAVLVIVLLVVLWGLSSGRQ